jgi:hypothetical protein
VISRRMMLCGSLWLLSGCGEDKPKAKLKIAGGGLQFNYRYSQASIIVVVQAKGEFSQGSKIETLFDKPGTTERESVSQPIFVGKLAYQFQSSPMLGIKKDDVFKVTVRLVDANGIELERQETQFKSDQDQSTLPSKPLVDPSKPNYVPQLENLK